MPDNKKATLQKHIRGSSLLLAGRLMAVAINFAGQVLVVRYLTQRDYGMWAYALAVIQLCSGLASLGLGRAIDRIIPSYHERGEYGKLIGTMIFVLATLFTAGSLIAAGFYLFPSAVGRFIPDDESWTLIYILVLMIPFEAVDILLIALFASFASPRAIFFRKHLMGPGLKLLVISLLIASESSVLFLAYGYLAATIVNVAVCTTLLLRMLYRDAAREGWTASRIEFPVGAVAKFSVPMITSDLLTVLLGSGGALFIGYFYGPEDVAIFRVALPAAMLNLIVLNSFSFLYTPQATRFFANGSIDEVGKLYWRTTVWSTVLSFPVFALTFAAAGPLTVLVFGSQYAQAGGLLAILALGYYAQVVLGMNQQTLKAMGKLRPLVINNVLTVGIFIGLNLLLVPVYGAMGAAIALSGSLITQNLLRQIVLQRVLALNIFEKKNIGFYAVLGAFSAVLLVIQLTVPPTSLVALPLAAAVAVCFFFMTKKHLAIADAFPELHRFLPSRKAESRKRISSWWRRSERPVVRPESPPEVPWETHGGPGPSS